MKDKKLVLFDFDGVLANTIECSQEALQNAIVELSKNYILSIVSSSRDNSIKIFLQKENINEYFSDILGTDIYSSKVVKIKSLLEKYSIQQQDAVLITDTLGDIKEAKECGVLSIGVLWGLHEKKTLEKGNPAKIIDSPLDLLDSVKEILG